MSPYDKDSVLREAIRRYGTVVLKRCRAILRDPALAEDAFQQAFLAFTRWLGSQPGVPQIEDVGGLVLTMAERSAIDLYRRRRRHEEVPLGQPGIVESSAGEWLYVDQLLDRLSQRERRIVELSVFAGLTASEIGHDLDLEPGTIRVIKLRALKKLRAMLRNDVTLPGGRGDE